MKQKEKKDVIELKGLGWEGEKLEGKNITWGTFAPATGEELKDALMKDDKLVTTLEEFGYGIREISEAINEKKLRVGKLTGNIVEEGRYNFWIIKIENKAYLIAEGRKRNYDYKEGYWAVSFDLGKERPAKVEGKPPENSKFTNDINATYILPPKDYGKAKLQEDELEKKMKDILSATPVKIIKE